MGPPRSRGACVEEADLTFIQRLDHRDPLDGRDRRTGPWIMPLTASGLSRR